MTRPVHRTAPFVVLALLAVAACPFVGPTPVGLSAAWGGEGAEIFWRLRVPRVAVAFAAGGSLSAAGLLLQSHFGTYLATPYTLGVAGGASAAVAAGGFLLVPPFVAGFLPSSVLLAGSGAVAGTLLLLAPGRGAGGPHALVLSGVVLNLVSADLVLLFQYLSDPAETLRTVRYLVGSVPTATVPEALLLLATSAAGFAGARRAARPLGAMLFGEEFAHGRGVDLVSARRWIIASTSLLVAGVVAVCGPIGFAGLVEPCLVRSRFGPDHRVLVPASFVAGGAFLCLSDAVARTVMAPAEMPVGIVTGLVGGPFFLRMVWRMRTTGGPALP